MPRSDRRLGIALAVGVAMVWLAVLPGRPLFNPDEGRYAEIPREMLAGGDWIIPHLDGLAYIEKPPLQYWATALSYRLLGTHPFAARLYTALSALALMGLVGFLGRRLWDEASGWRAAAILGSFALFAVLGQLLTLDMSLTLWMSISLAAFLVVQRGGNPRLMWVAWAATAAGVLTKGLVAALIPAAVLVLYTVITREWAVWRRLSLAGGLPLFLLLTVPWHWAAAERQADFLQFFFVHEHFARYLTPVAERQEAWWFFAAVLVCGSLPWTPAALRVIALGWRRQAPRGEFDVALFLWLWIVFVVGFFSLSDSKLIPYILPAMPPLALLIAAAPVSRCRWDVHVAAGLALGIAAVLGTAGLWLPEVLPPSPRNAYFMQLPQPLLRVAAVLATASVAALLRRGSDPGRGVAFCGFGWCVALVLLMRAAGVIAPLYSGVGAAPALAAAPAEVPLYSVALYDQSLPFYVGRSLTLVAYRGELDYGLRHAPPGTGLTLDEFVDRWGAATSGFAVMEPGMFEQLKSRGVPMRETHRELQRVVVSRQ